MRSILHAFRGALAIGLLAGAVTSQAQTNPTARAIPFTEAFPASAFTTYPSGFQGWNGLSGATVTSQAMAESSAATGNATLNSGTPTSVGAGGLYGMAGQAAVHTSSNATNGVNQWMMALNATNRMNITVGYKVSSVLANPRTVGVVAQYRVGTTGGWTTISASSGSNPYSQTGGTTGLKTTVSATLPSECNYQPVVQVRWAIWRGTETGNSSALGFDDVTVGGTLDTDHDGDPDSTDPCPLLANMAPGYSCDDGNANTGNDVITAGCVCVGTVANDECNSAGYLGAAQPYGGCSITQGNTSGAGPTGSVSCGGTTAKDVWYQFYTNYTSHAYIDLVAGTATGMGIEVIQSGCGGSAVYCATGLSHVVPVAPGQWHYVRVFSTTPGTFSICVSEPPINDDCANASSIGLNLFGDCPTNATAGTTVGATLTGTPGCNNTAVDVWYQFSSNFYYYNVTHAFIDLSAGTATGLGIQVFDNDCSGPAVYCGTGNAHSLPVTYGHTYYVRVFTATAGTFTICASASVANDDCVNASGIGLNLYGDCPTNATAGTTVGATLTGAPGCNNAAVDVWYQYSSNFYYYNVTHAFIDLSAGTATGLGIQVFDNDCSGPAVYCGTGNAHSLPVAYGHTYYVRVFTATAGTFTICASASVVNDDCVNAAGIGLNLHGDCPTNATAGTTVGATLTGAPSCNNAAVDVWYQFSSNFYYYNVTHAFIDLSPGTAGGLGIQVFDNDCSGPAVYCGTGNAHSLPVTYGHTYYVRVFTATAGTFTICASASVANDDCVNASGLGYPQGVGSCSGTAGTTVGATATSNPACAGTINADVWYSFNAISGTYTFIDLTSGNPAVLGVELFSTDCSGASVYCGTGGDHMVATTPGLTYYVRVFSTTPATFSICVSTENPYDECANAPSIPLNLQGDCPANATAGTTQNAQPSAGGTCGGGSGDIWYQVYSGSATAMVVNLASTGASGLGVQVLNACGGTVVYCGTGLSHGFVTDPGTTYWIRVFSAGEGGFTICASQTSGSPDCNGVPGGPATPGSACDDNDAATPYSYWQSNCTCLGYDCYGQLNGTALPGTACNDGNPCTIIDTWASNCACAGTYLPDGDGDGICDQEDDCPTIYGEAGWGCDDENPLTPNSSLDANCACIGHDCANVPAGPSMPGTPCTYPYASSGNTGVWSTGCACQWTDCHGDANGSAYADQCGVCVGGNTGLSPTTACLDCAGVPNGTSILDGCGTCRLPDDPGFVHVYQTMTFAGTPGFTSSLLQPASGAPQTSYMAQVKYTNSANTLPSFGYPRLILDYEGNGNFNGPNDRSVVMTPVDPSDLNTADGKLYTVQVTNLPVGLSWQARVQAFAGICVQDFGPYNHPDVLIAPDLQIFANDITFSNPNPDPSTSLTVKAAVHNTSDYPISGAVVRLKNEYAPDAQYGEVVLAALPPHGVDTATWIIITPGQAAWCPMRVTVDPANTIAETNELNNDAVRPFINGPYNLPGGIHVYAQATPYVSCVGPITTCDPLECPKVTIYGNAYYYGTAVPLLDSSVAGATLTLNAFCGPISTYTNEDGFFSVTFCVENYPDTFAVAGHVTDFTLDSDFDVEYIRIECAPPPLLPDLATELFIDDNTLAPGDAASGTIRVSNTGTADVTIPSALHVQQTGGSPLIPNATVPPLAIGAHHDVPFSGIVFNTAGIYTITVTADAEEDVIELDEANNSNQGSIVVGPDLSPGIVPVGAGAFLYGGGLACGTVYQPVLRVSNGGVSAAGPFNVHVAVFKDDVYQSAYSEPVTGLATGAYHDFSIAYTMAAAGHYRYEVTCDVSNAVAEYEEGNNAHNFGFDVEDCGRDIYPWSGPNGSGYVCQTSSPSFTVRNGGNTPTAAFDVRVTVRLNGDVQQVFTESVPGLPAPGDHTFSIPWTYTTVGAYTFEVECDISHEVAETNEDNNVATYAVSITGCAPDLVVSRPGCGQMTVSPIDPQYPGMVTYTAILTNAGNAAAVDPVVRFTVLTPGEPDVITEVDVPYTGTLAPGTSVVVNTQMASVPPATSSLAFTADPNNLIAESAESNNQTLAGQLCWDFQPVPLPPTCYPPGNFWERSYGREQPIPLYIGVWDSHLYWASEVRVRFSVSGPGVPGTVVLGDALVHNVNDQYACIYPCPWFAGLPNTFVPPLAGVYTFTMTVDPDNPYTECNEGNNVLVRQVTVLDLPNMRVLSQFINPSQLNPEVNEPITFNVTYENTGTGNTSDLMDLQVRVNNDELVTIHDVPGLLSGSSNTIAVPVSWSSDLVGIHVVRTIIDAAEEIDEIDEFDNEATRAVIVGESSNLYFASFYASDPSPEPGSTVTLHASVANNGDLSNIGEVWFYSVIGVDTTFIGAHAVSVLPGSSIALERPYTVTSVPATILGRIRNVQALEFNDEDNEALVFLSTFDVSITSSFGCSGVSLGSLAASASGGSAPYTYFWSNGASGPVLQAPAGTYTVVVTDSQGRSAMASGTIENDANCTTAPVLVSVRAALEGPYNTATSLMNDALRSLPTFPLNDPYPALGYTHVGPGNTGTLNTSALAVTGSNAVVDWVILELRQDGVPATRVATRHALLQRDGDVVALDGVSPVGFAVPPGNYHVALRHRNHLGVMTNSAVALSYAPVTVDFRTLATATYGTAARKTSGGAVPIQVLWAGDVTFNHQIKYTGPSNDRDPILVTVGSTTPNNILSNTYSTRDVNMNGNVQYTGSGNDRDPILVNVGSTTPNNLRVEQVP